MPARVVIWLCFAVCGVVTVLLLGRWLTEGFPPPSLWVAWACTLIIAGLPWVVRVTGRYRDVALAVLVLGGSAILLRIALTGGGPAPSWRGCPWWRWPGWPPSGPGRRA